MYFVHFDSPKVDIEFMDSIQKSKLDSINICIIEEVHEFISNVYNESQKSKLCI